MAENNPYLKSVYELLNYNFFIPSYQRGYRWTNQEVEDLLKDINDFVPKEVENSDYKTWYCLQPLVIKKCDKEIIEKFQLGIGKDWYETIDGQQRITTIFLLVHYINEMWKGRQKFNEFQLKYETRDESEEFLKHLKIDEFDKINIDKENVDFFHISVAYQTIHSWFKSQKNFDTSNFESKFIHSVKVIWYETLTLDSINIFTRLNMGKIPLTNSELIKALFLNSSNFKKAEPDKVRLMQLEIASEWDRIEYALQDESFWYFLNKETNLITPRIEFIFDLIAKKESNKIDDYFTFRHFSKKFNNKTEKEITDNWQEIKVYYQTLEEWFINRELYHKVGFLIATGTEIKSLISLKENKSKIEFKESLNGLIKEKVKVQLSELEYQKGPVKNVLLLYNIQTMLNNTNETNRFPFHRYKKENWDVEHISAVAEEMPKTEKHQKDWLTEVLKFLPVKLKSKAQNYNKSEFQEVYNQILKHFDDEEKVENENDISNLALLDSKTNRGYGNAVFAVKRGKIILKDKAGIFIPICTKNVFMKLYNDNVDQMTFWGEKDRQVYLKDIDDTLHFFLPKQINITNE